MATNLNRLLALAGFTFACASASAAVTAEEAASLKSMLTPFGAEKAGNAAGTIPAWTGSTLPSARR